MSVDQIISIIQKARKIRQKVSESIQFYSLSFNEFELLYVLTLVNECTPSKLSSVMGQGNSTVSRVLRTLCDKQLITLNTNHIDRRNISVRLTMRGQQLYTKIESRIRMHMA